MGLLNVLKNFRKVFGNWRYLLLGVFVAFLFYALNVLIYSFGILKSFYSTLGFVGTFKLFFSLMKGFGNTIETHSYVSLIIISILFGIFFSLIGYKVRVLNDTGNKKIGFFASVGLFLGILVPGCAVCGIGILSALGLSAAVLSFLPYKGLELSILSIVILGIVIFKISNELNVCKVKKR